ncbi:hypothetical protein UXN85_20845 [Enterobacter hormaechei]
MRDFLIIALILATLGNAWVGWADNKRIHKVVAILGVVALALEFLW